MHHPHLSETRLKAKTGEEQIEQKVSRCSASAAKVVISRVLEMGSNLNWSAPLSSRADVGGTSPPFLAPRWPGRTLQRFLAPSLIVQPLIQHSMATTDSDHNYFGSFPFLVSLLKQKVWKIKNYEDAKYSCSGSIACSPDPGPDPCRPSLLARASIQPFHFRQMMKNIFLAF